MPRPVRVATVSPAPSRATLATLQLRGAFTQPVSHAGIGVTVLYYGGVAPFVAAWLVGAAAVWLLWRPASTAFFKSPTDSRSDWAHSRDGAS